MIKYNERQVENDRGFSAKFRDVKTVKTMDALKCGGGGKDDLIKIGAIRGRNPENPLSRVSGLPTEQMLEINENGTSNALTTVQKDNVVIIPTTIIEASLIGAAKLSKLGTLFKRSVEVVGLEIPLIYNGPKDIDGLWDKKFYDARSVKVGAAKIMRYRPRFNEWSLEFIIQFDEKNIDVHDVKKALIEAGTQIGICDYRPKFGRFDVVYADEVE